jgi:hypothetical protein
LVIKGVPHSSSKNTETTHHCCCCVLLHSLYESLCVQNSWEQAFEISSNYDTCMGRRPIKFLKSATLRDCSLVQTTTYWWCALLCHYFQKNIHGTTLLLFFLHQIRSTTSTCSTCRLLGTASPVPPALVLPLGTILSSLIYLLCSFWLNVNTSNPYNIIILLIFTHNIICFIIFEIKI